MVAPFFLIQFIDPVGYYDMLELLKNCSMVITDSGGLQKEAFFNKKQCIVVANDATVKRLIQGSVTINPEVTR